MKSAGREGFSLLEVLMATSILLGSVIVLNQLASIGRKNAVAAQDLSTAQMLCQSRVNEILTGAVAAEAVDEEPLPEAPGWVYSLSLEPVDSATVGDRQKLTALQLTVSREEAERQSASSFTLVRWIAESTSGGRAGGTSQVAPPRASDRSAGRL